jgi:hypothetical protein
MKNFYGIFEMLRLYGKAAFPGEDHGGFSAAIAKPPWSGARRAASPIIGFHFVPILSIFAPSKHNRYRNDCKRNTATISGLLCQQKP